MSVWSKIVLFCILLIGAGTPSCTYYTEKQTEAVSQTVYATKDSIDKARFDLADEYSTQATRLVKPPKNRLEISYLNNVITLNSSKQEATKPGSKAPKSPVIIIPERLRGLSVMVVNSQEYELLLQDKEAHEQLKIDHDNLDITKKAVDEELITQSIFRDKMVSDLNSMKETIHKKNIVIYKLSLTSATLSLVLVASVVLKVKGII